MPTYISRRDAAAFITGKGVPIAAATLTAKAGEGTGPKYCVINHKALYTPEDCLEWIAQEAARTPQRQPRTTPRTHGRRPRLAASA
jgi:hypothetical protein